MRDALNRIPLTFEANVGQTDERVKFFARGAGYRVFLTAIETVIEIRTMTAPGQRMKMAGADRNPAFVTGEPVRGRTNYFVGSDRATWRRDVPMYDRVSLKDVYPGIDVVHYGNHKQQLEYDFVVAPRANPRAIALEFEGADVTIDGKSDLVLRAGRREFRQQRPIVYQMIGDARQDVAAWYVARGPRTVGVQVASYVASLPLVIDPVLDLGATGVGIGAASAVDSAGNMLIAGFTVALPEPQVFHRRVPVTILSNANFDVRDLDLATVTFGRTGTEAPVAKCFKFQDANKDGRPDLRCDFQNLTSGFQVGDTGALLKGSLLSDPDVTVTLSGPIRTAPVKGGK